MRSTTTTATCFSSGNRSERTREGPTISSWLSPKTEKRTSPIEGRGLFARDAIRAGEIVAVKGGVVMDAAALARVRDEVSPAEIQIEDGLYIAPGRAEDVEANLLCLNHSCNPNVGVRGQITFVAMRDVPAGAELTIDYAMIDGDPAERMACACGAPECRTIITGSDWRLKELQRRYSGYFSRYIHDRFVADGG
ncbi:MAG: hypothetical protein AUG14_09920 [Candidatus Rokubacteria bacterium 13_1_20CM_2_68_19]|nr:MAG: hypothetical protein AUG14_09920 [Candidatus Rokubacteria bacterium 13_1_20CM_2_68_19]